MKNTLTICLVIPGSFYLIDMYKNNPLGILYIAGVLEQAGYTVIIADLRGMDKSLPMADIYGFTATTPEYPAAIEIAKRVKKKYNAYTVLGGVHASVANEEIDPTFDKRVMGEGETAILDVMTDFKNGNTEKKVYHSERIKNIDSIPFPARHLMPSNLVISKSLVDKGKIGTTMITSRGCPYSCSFCASKPLWGTQVTFRTPDNIVDEIQYLKNRYGIEQCRFQDDTMALDSNRLLTLCEQLKSLHIQWRCSSRVDVGQTKEELQAMADAGCREIGYGLETVSEQALALTGKGITVEQAAAAIERTKAVGIRVRLYMIMGLPGEEPGIAERSIKFFEQTKPDIVLFTTLVPYPGSRIAKYPDKFGAIIKDCIYQDYSSMIGTVDTELESSFIVSYKDWQEVDLQHERRSVYKYLEENGLNGGKS